MVYQETGDVPFPKGTASHTYPNGVTVTETPSISTTLTVTVVGAEATSVLKHYYRLLEEYGGTVTVHSTFPEKVKALFEDTSGMWERIQILWRWIRHGE